MGDNWIGTDIYTLVYINWYLIRTILILYGPIWRKNLKNSGYMYMCN